MSTPEKFIFAPEAAPAEPSAGDNLAHEKPDQIKKDLADFSRQIGKREEKQNEDFLKQFADMEKQGATPENILGIRRGGTTKEQNGLDRHVKLSAAFTTGETGSPVTGAANSNQNTISINFRGNSLAERYVGLGDILPPHAERVKVYGLDGQIITGGAVRKINPATGRIGYYDESTGAYIPIHSGFRVSIIASRTDSPKNFPDGDPTLQRRKLAEAVTVYRDQQTFNRDFFAREDDQKGVPAPKPNTVPEQFNFASIPNEPDPAATKASIPDSGQPQKSFSEYNPAPLKQIPRGIPQKANEILHRGNPIGTVTVFEQNGKTYIARDEVHRHAPTDNVPDALKRNHHGVTVYEAQTA